MTTERVCEDNCPTCLKGANGNYKGARVTITSADGAAIVFSALAEDNKVREYKMAWADASKMWVYCPSTLPSDSNAPDEPNHPLPAAGATGILYFDEPSNKVVKDTSGVAKPILLSVKYPHKAPATPEYLPLPLHVLSVQVTGDFVTADGAVESGTVELLNPTLARAGQIIDTANSHLRLDLSAEGFATFGVSFVTLDEVTEAVDMITGPKPKEPQVLVAAWSTVSRAVSQLRAPPDPAGHMGPQLLMQVKRALPDFEL